MKDKGIIPILMAVGTIGVLLPIMLPGWEWAGIAGWGTALVAYGIALAVALHRFTQR